MRFDPKLIQPEAAPLDDQGEIELPDDLGELAAQLRDDALFLSARYPARAPLASMEATVVEAVEVEAPVLAESFVTSVAKVPSSSRRPLIIAVTAASALGLLVVAGLYRPANLHPHASESHSSVKHVLAQEVAPATETSRLVQPRDVAPTPSSTRPTTLLLNGVSGPEMEGLLDLWQSSGETDSRISF